MSKAWILSSVPLFFCLSLPECSIFHCLRKRRRQRSVCPILTSGLSWGEEIEFQNYIVSSLKFEWWNHMFSKWISPFLRVSITSINEEWDMVGERSQQGSGSYKRESIIPLKRQHKSVEFCSGSRTRPGEEWSRNGWLTKAKVPGSIIETWFTIQVKLRSRAFSRKIWVRLKSSATRQADDA